MCCHRLRSPSPYLLIHSSPTSSVFWGRRREVETTMLWLQPMLQDVSSLRGKSRKSLPFSKVCSWSLSSSSIIAYISYQLRTWPMTLLHKCQRSMHAAKSSLDYPRSLTLVSLLSFQQNGSLSLYLPSHMLWLLTATLCTLMVSISLDLSVSKTLTAHGLQQLTSKTRLLASTKRSKAQQRRLRSWLMM